LKEAIVRSEAECISLCQNFEGVDTNSDGIIDEYCNWFVYDIYGHTCQLLDGCLTADNYDSTYVSGSFGCQSEIYGLC